MELGLELKSNIKDRGSLSTYHSATSLKVQSPWVKDDTQEQSKHKPGDDGCFSGIGLK